MLPASDLGVTDRMGQNALHECITTANQEGFQLLLSLMSDVDARTVPGIAVDGTTMLLINRTPLHLACHFG